MARQRLGVQEQGEVSLFAWVHASSVDGSLLLDVYELLACVVSVVLYMQGDVACMQKCCLVRSKHPWLMVCLFKTCNERLFVW